MNTSLCVITDICKYSASPHNKVIPDNSCICLHITLFRIFHCLPIVSNKACITARLYASTATIRHSIHPLLRYTDVDLTLQKPVTQIPQCTCSISQMHHSVTELCTCVHISVTERWCIVGYLLNALWYLWYEFNVSVVLVLSFTFIMYVCVFTHN